LQRRSSELREGTNLPANQRGRKLPAQPPSDTETESQTVRAIVRAELQSTSFSGPLPPPEMLREYDQIYPGAAEKIIQMAESQLHHRQSLERQVIEAEIRQAARGQWIAGAIALAGLLAATLVGVFGSPVVGGAIAAMDVVGLAAVFIYGSHQKRAEREERVKALAGDHT